MTYGEIKEKQKRIKEIRTEIELIRTEGENTTQKLSPVPVSGNLTDKVANTAIRICNLKNEIERLEDEIKCAVNSLPDSLEGNYIRLYVKGHYTWQRLALVAGGGNSAESIKKMCYRYRW